MSTPDPEAGPIDYFNPLRKPEVAAEAPSATPKRPAAVVPVEFDTVLTRSADHAAVAAIEAALRVRKLISFRTDDGEMVGREMVIYVRAEDFPAAAPVAAQIFARRQRVKTILPPKPVKPDSVIDLPDDAGYYF